MSTTVLEISKLSKSYKKVKALNELSLKVEKGTIFGILGPNGSGKTTTLGILLGVLRASGGSFSWFNNGEKTENRLRIGAMLETPNFYPYLSAVKNLKIVAKIKQLNAGVDIDQRWSLNLNDRIDEVLKAVNLYERKDSKFSTYSLGMKQRLAIASTLLNDPEVLLLDEPTNGLDPQGIAEIRQLILDIAKDGRTILIASHQLDEIEKVCTDVVILKKGVSIRQSQIENIVGKVRQMVISGSDLEAMANLANKFAGVSVNSQTKTSLILDVDESVTTSKINQYFFENELVLSELREIKKSLEDQFLEITKG
ncbi:MAG: ATP-binding cassette domain-containing protein [Crocinitomicaceae bacterium]|nr:ATP-binding cassette domain-containing protein [Crocinitomicaceae bacterium]